MSRYKVAHLIVSFKGKKYSQGEYLPETFTEKDRRHNSCPHRIIEVPEPVTNLQLGDIPKVEMPQKVVTPEIAPKALSAGIINAQGIPAPQVKITGTPILPIKK